jgi:hypothetical protein
VERINRGRTQTKQARQDSNNESDGKRHTGHPEQPGYKTEKLRRRQLLNSK